jgi:hypothetical protein
VTTAEADETELGRSCSRVRGATFEALDRTLHKAVIIRRDLEVGRYPTVEATTAALQNLKETGVA